MTIRRERTIAVTSPTASTRGMIRSRPMYRRILRPRRGRCDGPTAGATAGATDAGTDMAAGLRGDVVVDAHLPAADDDRASQLRGSEPAQLDVGDDARWEPKRDERHVGDSTHD